MQYIKLSIVFTVFAIFATVHPANAELEIQINYGNSFQVFDSGKPSTLIDPNFIIQIGNQYIKNHTHYYHHLTETQLDCGDETLVQAASGSTMLNYYYHDSELNVFTKSQFWPNDFWSLFRSNSIVCSYNWHFQLFNQLNKQPIFLIGEFNNIHKLVPEQQFPTIPHIPLRAAFTLTKPI